MAQTLLNSYLDLPLDGRDAALTTLIRSLGQRDRDFVQNLICDARDPFYRLPIELLINVFDSLHPFDVWTKRLVCRRWKTVLSADKFTRTAIKRFDTHEPEDSALDAEVAALSSHTSAIRHILALRYGRPFSYVKISDEFTCVPSSHPVTHLIRLKGKHLAYLRGNSKTREGNTVIVRDLVSGRVSSLCGTAREKIMSVHLTAEIVAFLTYAGTIYVASLLDLTNSLRCIRLPSSSVLTTSSCRATVACLLQGSSSLTAVIYDAETRRTHSFGLQAVHSPSISPGCYTILADSQKQCIDVFIVRKATKRLGPRIEVSRYSYAGEMSTRIWFEMQPETSMAENVSIGSVEPTGECGIHQIPLKYEGGRLYKGGHWLTRWTLIYDATSMALKAIDCFYARSRCDHNDLPKPALWKDRLYRGDKRPLLISTARRLASIDGPHTLRQMRNEANPEYGELGFDYMAKEEEEEEEESDVDKTKDSMLAQPMSVRSWKRDYQLFAQRYLQWARLQDQPTDLSDFNTPNNRHPFKEFGQDTQGYVISPSKEGPELFHTIVAMNDTFAVGTCHSHGCVGVVCFDERVALHGAGSTFLWDELDSQLRCGSGPGLLRFVTDPDSDSDSEMDSE